MGSTSFLFFHLEAPLQSWGMTSRWEYRDSCHEPTKSGVIGILACALGYGKNDPRIAAELSAHLHMAIREDRAGTILTDFHTISGAFPKAGGGRFPRTHTIISQREYLEDASFLVILEGELALLEKCATALKSPRWPYYLGRKSCIPTVPIIPIISTEYRSREDALQHYPPLVSLNRKLSLDTPLTLRCVNEDPSGNLTYNDVNSTAPSRMFQSRRVSESWVQFQPEKRGDALVFEPISS